MTKQPLAEVFGYPIRNLSHEAQIGRANKLCPFNNTSANCTKDKANAPLGVCSIFNNRGLPVITCPVRFREKWSVPVDAAQFFFPAGAQWTSLMEVRLNTAEGKSAGKIDMVLVRYDENGKLLDFGGLEVQAVYISGNVRNPFEHYMQDVIQNANMEWRVSKDYPKPDYLSSSRKRLAPQLLFKGGILSGWGKKSAVVLNSEFFDTLPPLEEVSIEDAQIAWLIYDLLPTFADDQYTLTKVRTVYTRFSDALAKITVARAGDVRDFESVLQQKLNKKHITPPTNTSLDKLL